MTNNQITNNIQYSLYIAHFRAFFENESFSRRGIEVSFTCD